MNTHIRFAAVVLVVVSALSLALGLSASNLPIEDSDSHPPPYLVKDFRWLTESSDPECFVFKDQLLCSADDGTHGRELWVSDGTESGTYLMADIVPGEDSWLDNHPRYFVDPGGEYVLLETRAGNLWRTDGTEAGTYPIRDSESGKQLYSPSWFVHANVIYVSARLGQDYSQGSDLWRTDGTEAGTHIVKELNSIGYSEVDLSYASDMGSYLLFVADDGTHGRELWRSNGTEGGTYLVKDLRPGEDGSYLNGLQRFGDLLLFHADDGLHGFEMWRTDGTEDGTYMVRDIYTGTTSSWPLFTQYQDMLIGKAEDEVHGIELWRSDGTEEGTVLLKDILPGAESGNPQSFIEYDGLLYFLTQTDDVSQLWKTDGTSDGTAFVAALNARALYMKESSVGILAMTYERYSSKSQCYLHRLDPLTGTLLTLHDEPFIDWGDYDCNVAGWWDFDEVILFTGITEGEGKELWRTDGTAAGTFLAMDPVPGRSWSNPWVIADTRHLDGRLYLSASQPGDRELWWLELETAEWDQAVDINQHPYLLLQPTQVVGSSGDFVYLLGDDGLQTGLFRTDGTSENTHFLKEVRSYMHSQAGGGHYTSNGDLWLLIFDKLYRSDGTPEGTKLFWDFGTPNATEMAVVDDIVFVNFAEPYGGLIGDWAVAVTDGTGPPEELVYFDTADQLKLYPIPDKVMLFYTERYGKGELWRSEGTPETTTIVANVFMPGRPGFIWGEELYFEGYQEYGENGLWQSNGTEAGTKQVVPNQHNLKQFTATDDWLYYLAKFDLWRTDGTEAGTKKVSTLVDFEVGDQFQSLLGIGNQLYLVVSRASTQKELWVTDGSEQGTRLLHTVPANADTEPQIGQLMAAGDRLTFVAGWRYAQQDIWISDGSVAGTQLLTEDPPLTVFGTVNLRGYWNDLLFIGDLWAQPLPEQTSESACPVDANVVNQLTSIIGKGMGTRRSIRNARVSVPDASNLASLYGQMAAKQYPGVRYVRFIYPDRSYVQVKTATYAGERGAISWWAADLDVTKLEQRPFVKGRWFMTKGTRRISLTRAFVLYPTHSTAEAYANVWSTFKAPDNYVSSSPNYSQSSINMLEIPEIQAPADVSLQFAITDLIPDSGIVEMTVTAGGVEEKVSLAEGVTRKQGMLGIVEVTLRDVPAGTTEVTIALRTTRDVNAAAALLGATAHYACDLP